MPGATSGRQAWHALVRTHHITSRKKVAKLRQAAAHENVYALLRSGSSPGIMYVEGPKVNVENWVATVQRLRYKDFQLAGRPSEIQPETQPQEEDAEQTGLFETESVKDFASRMDKRGILAWWREAMGYTGSEDRL